MTDVKRTLATFAVIGMLCTSLGVVLRAQRSGAPPAPPPPQQPSTLPPGTVVMSGRVLDDETGVGITGVPLEFTVLRTTAGQPQVYRASAVSADGGRFEVGTLPAGSVNIRPASTAFIAARPPSATPVNDGDHMGGMEVRLVRSGEIRGRVLGEDGVPLRNLPVRLFKLHPFRRSYLPQPIVPTDGEGRFIVLNLAPGEYLAGVDVVATTMPRSIADSFGRGFKTLTGQPLTFDPVEDSYARFPASTGVVLGNELFARTARDSGARIPDPPPLAGAARTYRTTFYPAAASMTEATVLKLKSGGTVENVEITMKAVPARRVTGTLMTEAGPAAFVGVRLHDLQGGLHYVDSYGEIAASTTDASGKFSMANVPEGRYRLRAFVLEPRGAAVTISRPFRHWIDVPVDVRDTDLILPPIGLKAPYSIEGQVVHDKPPPTAPAGARNGVVRLTLMGPMWAANPLLGTVDANGRFRVDNVVGERYEMTITNVPGSIRAVVADGVDVTATHLDFSQGPLGNVTVHMAPMTQLTITVEDAVGGGVANAEVLIFPKDYQGWLRNGAVSGVAVTARTGAAGVWGAFLPAGDYLAIAYEHESALVPDYTRTYPRQTWADPRLVSAAAPRATPVTIHSGRITRATLRMIK